MDTVLFSDAMGMIDDHFIREAESYHQPRRIGWKKASSVAASVILMIILTGCLLLALSPTVSASFWGWIRTIEDRIVRYTYSEKYDSQENICFALGFVPDGYAHLTEVITEHSSTQIFVDTSGNLLVFTFVKGSDTTSLDLYETNTLNMKQVFINGCTADLYFSSDPHESGIVVWFDPIWDRLFTVSGFINEETLIQIAENIYPINNSHENFAGE